MAENRSTTIERDNLVLFEDLTPDKDGGVIKTITKPGEGDDTPAEGCKVFVHYTGRLVDGEKFDSSRDRGNVFTFIAGKNYVIKGWDLGILTMHKNEICELKILPQYAYGEEGFSPKIPGNATLIFEMELLGWDDEEVTPDGGVRKQLMKEGSGKTRPNVDSLVKVHLRGSYLGRWFEERDVEFVVGEGYEVGIIDGVEKAICKMKCYEKAKVFIKSKYAFGKNGSENFDIPPDAEEVEYEICLFKFEKAKELYELEYDEKIARSETLKERALKCIKAGEYTKAIEYYDRVLNFVRINKQDSDYARGFPYKVAANSNAALCYLKLDDHYNAKLRCEKVLKLDENNVKGYFRLGGACIGLSEYNKAVEAYENALKIEPDNAAIKKELNNAKSLLKKQVEKEKTLYGNIFAKLGD